MFKAQCLLIGAVAVLSTASTTAQTTDYVQGVSNLRSDGGASVEVRVDETSGKAKFVRAQPGSPVSPAGESAAMKGRKFFQRYGSAFGVSDPFEELVHTNTLRDNTGTEHAVFKQLYRGLPVFGGELRAHFNHQGQLIAANGNFVESLKLDITPNLNREMAEEIATRRIFGQLEQARRARLSSDDDPLLGSDESELAELTSATTELMIFRTGLVRGVAGADHLAYQVEVVNPGVSVREFVYVDALSGKVLDQITGIHDALNRRAYDAQGAAHPGPNYPGSPFWVEGDPLPTGTAEADNMIYASGETYDMFSGAFGRDSFDGAGATMDSIFNRGDGCPNASWNGIYISFCPGLTTDDVTGHEWGHAYTQFTNNLIYQWQSGALNESYSDIWGETVDLINGRGLDTPGGARTGCAPGDTSVRWMMGEETSIGALRDMWDPTCPGSNSPGKVSDSEYWCTAGDNGGVHFNSGVPNHAYALMVDGGTYNSVTVSALGLLKAAHIEWGAQNMLTPTSNFADNADALEASCAALIGVNLTDFDGTASGTMISAGDCTEVADAVAAVEMRAFPTQCGFDTLLDPNAPALCDGLGTVQTVHYEDFEGGTLPAGWTASEHDVVSPGTFDNPGWSITSSLPSGASGTYGAFGPDPIEGDCSTDIEAGAIALDSPVISLPAGEIPHVAFDHWVATEAGWDGANLKISVNAGAWTLVPGSAYSFNPYNGAINGGANDNPLGGEEAFTGTDEGFLNGSWGQSQIDLIGLASPGDDIQLRFDVGTDGCNGVIGWYVDSVRTYTCSNETVGVCGDGLPDPGEECDDGNTADGDGCSSTCEVEDGWSCTDAVPPGSSSNVVADWSFESGNASGDWTATSSDNPFPEFPLCGPTNGCPAAGLLGNTGSWFVWIGGSASGVTSHVEQSVTIPATATDLTLYAWRGICDDPSDILHVSLDAVDIGTLACSTTDGDWMQQTFSVAGYNDGASHDLKIGGTVGGTNGTHSNFFVDDVVIEDNLATPGEPSMCVPVTGDLACHQVVDFASGLPGSWSVVDNEGNGVVWTDVATSGEAGNYTGGTGDAASVSSDAVGAAEFDTELRSNSFSLASATSASLDYLANYQNFAALDFLDVDISTNGGTSWTNLLSWNEDHGGFRATPGEAVSINLASYLGASDVMLRWRYYDPNTGDFDWYAQLDDIGLVCDEGCGIGISDSLDVTGEQMGSVHKKACTRITALNGFSTAPGSTVILQAGVVVGFENGSSAGNGLTVRIQAP